VRLLGKFVATVRGSHLEALPGRRTTELLGYLLLYRERPHHREVLAGTLWPESTSTQSRKYLRQGLWQIGALQADPRAGSTVITTSADWVRVDPAALWLDVAELERAFIPVRLIAGEHLDEAQADALKQAAGLYRGNLLEGCYQDWCIYERERLKAMHIAILEKLLGHCEGNSAPEEGLAYGEELLRNEPAHERGHWRLMRLLYLAGDRTGALRQFERCRNALSDELGVAPGQRTRALYERIRADAGVDGPVETSGRTGAPRPAPPPESEPCRCTDDPETTALGARAIRLAAEPLEEAVRAVALAGRLLEQSIRGGQEER
jgi:DNA-binding SARP family transcriptional activator